MTTSDEYFEDCSVLRESQPLLDWQQYSAIHDSLVHLSPWHLLCAIGQLIAVKVKEAWSVFASVRVPQVSFGGIYQEHPLA